VAKEILEEVGVFATALEMLQTMRTKMMSSKKMIMPPTVKVVMALRLAVSRLTEAVAVEDATVEAIEVATDVVVITGTLLLLSIRMRAGQSSLEHSPTNAVKLLHIMQALLVEGIAEENTLDVVVGADEAEGEIRTK
jgi:hypothetical protein